MKRTSDLIVAVVAFVALSPVLALIALLIRLKLGRPILFRQARAGRHGEPFVLVKFRTMLDTVGGDGSELPDELRLTRFGKLLRSTSADELPQLINILRGEMSLVGPRPLLMEYLPLYSPQQARRHEVRPGLTGWAQVNGRNALTWEEKFACDIWYIDHQSFSLDVRILWLTLRKVLFRNGISADGSTTMPRFTGSER